MMDARTLTIQFVTQTITQFLVPLLMVILTYASAQVTRWLLARVSKERLILAKQIVLMAVNTSEQLGATGKIEDKYSFALQQAQKMLNSRGIYINIEELIQMVESTVFEEFNKFPDVSATSPTEPMTVEAVDSE